MSGEGESDRGGGAGAEGSEIKAAREVLILEILLVRRKELQRSEEEGGLVSGGWRRFLTVEKRLRGLWLVLLMREE